jgi:hypothetical protein
MSTQHKIYSDFYKQSEAGMNNFYSFHNHSQIHGVKQTNEYNG